VRTSAASRPPAIDADTTLARAYLLMIQHSCTALDVLVDGKLAGRVDMKTIQEVVESYKRGNPLGAASLTVGPYMEAKLPS
jgi:CBS domain-containing protein